MCSTSKTTLGNSRPDALCVTYAYGDRRFTLSPYNTKQEKDLLILGAISEPDDANMLNYALEITGVRSLTYDVLSEREKLALLYKLREISVGSQVNVQFTCKKCKSGNENYIDVENTVLGLANPDNDPGTTITDVYKDVEPNLHEFLSVTPDTVLDMELDEYEAAINVVRGAVTRFEFMRPVSCQKCGSTNYVDAGVPKFCVDVMSEDSMVSLFQTYNDLTFFGGYNKQDVDSMYPFERTILITMLNKTREELNK